MYIKKVKYLCIFFTIFSIYSCDLYRSTIEIEVSLPTEFDSFEEETNRQWILLYKDIKSGKSKKIVLDSSIDELKLTIPKGNIYPVVLHHEIKFSNGNTFITYPAGFVYPYSENFEWEKGFESQLLFSLSNYMDINRLNYTKLSSAINDVSEGKPWVLDSDLIIVDILAGSFKSYDLRKRSKKTIEIFLPQGMWQSEYVLEEKLISTSKSLPTEYDMFVGYNRFYNSKGLVLEADLKSDGSFNLIIY